MRLVRPITAREVFQEIRHYCDTRASLGGAWTQECYKQDYFRIFYNAYANGRTGAAAWSKYATAKKRRKSTKIAEFVVHDENIERYLKRYWTSDKRWHRMIHDLCQWWNDWTYCLDSSPREIRRAYFRKQ